jgi:hypothetical protein
MRLSPMQRLAAVGAAAPGLITFIGWLGDFDYVAGLFGFDGWERSAFHLLGHPPAWLALIYVSAVVVAVAAAQRRSTDRQLSEINAEVAGMREEMRTLHGRTLSEAGTRIDGIQNKVDAFQRGMEQRERERR